MVHRIVQYKRKKKEIVTLNCMGAHSQLKLRNRKALMVFLCVLAALFVGTTRAYCKI